MENTESTNPATATPADNGGTNTPANTPAEPPKQTNGAEHQPYKTFATQEEFDRHSAGILNSAQKKAEKELLAMLGLKPDEKDKLAKFKEAYDSTLSESEKKAKELESATAELSTAKGRIAELEATVAAIAKATGKKADDVSKYVRMARGLVDENTTIEQALEQVFGMMKAEDTKPNVPHGTPPADNAKVPHGENPWKTKDLDKQTEIFRKDKEEARRLYKEATGKNASW